MGQLIEERIVPFADTVARLDQIAGVGVTTARVMVAEVGVDMSRFPTPAHLASWVRFTPGVIAYNGREKGNGATGHGNRYLAAALGEAAVSAAKTETSWASGTDASSADAARRRTSSRSIGQS